MDRQPIDSPVRKSVPVLLLLLVLLLTLEWEVDSIFPFDRPLREDRVF